MHGEQLVIGLCLEEVSGWRQQLQPYQDGEKAADEKEQRDGSQIKQGNSFVVGGEQPGLHAIVDVEIVFTCFYRYGGSGWGTHYFWFCLSGAVRAFA